MRRVRTNSTYMWAHEGLGRGPTALPPKFRWGDKTFSTNMQSSFDKAIHAVRNDASFSHLPDVRTVPIAIMALDRNGGRPVAGQREFEMFYSGSLLKVVAMYAAYQLRVAVNDLAPTLNATVNTTDKLFQTISNTFDKQIDESVPRIRLAPGITPAMKIPKYKTIFQAEKIGGVWRFKFNETGGANNVAGQLRRMIVGSHNEPAGFCIRALGYSWINGVLQAAGFLRFGFPGSEGLWLAGDYGQQKTVTIPSVNDGDVKQAATSFDMAQLFALLHDKKLVRNTAHYATALSGNDEMLNLLKDAVDDPGAPSLLKRVPHSFVVR